MELNKCKCGFKDWLQVGNKLYCQNCKEPYPSPDPVIRELEKEVANLIAELRNELIKIDVISKFCNSTIAEHKKEIYRNSNTGNPNLVRRSRGVIWACNKLKQILKRGEK